MQSLARDEYHYFQTVPIGHHLTDKQYKRQNCCYKTLRSDCGCGHSYKIAQQQPKYRLDDANEEPFVYHHIISHDQYKQRLFLLIHSISAQKNVNKFIPNEVVSIIIHYYSPFHHPLIQNSFYCIYECPSFIEIKYEFDKLKRSKLQNKMSYIECIDIEPDEYLSCTYTPTLSNGKKFAFHSESSSYIRSNDMIFKIGTNKVYNNNKYTNISYNLKNGQITKLPMMNTSRFDAGLCYSDKYGIICVGGKSTLNKTGIYQYTYYNNVSQLKLNNPNNMEWISLPGISTKRFATSCMMINGEDKMIVCGGKVGVVDYSEGAEDEADDSKLCELYDFVESKWIQLEETPHPISWNGSLTQSVCLNNSVVGVYGRNCMHYDWSKNKWYSLPDTNNTYYYSFKLMETDNINIPIMEQNNLDRFMVHSDDESGTFDDTDDDIDDIEDDIDDDEKYENYDENGDDTMMEVREGMNRISSAPSISSNILTVIGLEEEPSINWVGAWLGDDDDKYWINIEIYDSRDNRNKWIELEKIEVDSKYIKAII